MLIDRNLIKLGFACKCPRCGIGDLYASKWSFTVNEICTNCGFELAKNDSADGPAVFLIFILGFTVVPLALLFEHLFHPPLFVHVILWGIVLLGATLGMLRPAKAYIIALQYKHRASDWEKP